MKKIFYRSGIVCSLALFLVVFGQTARSQQTADQGFSNPKILIGPGDLIEMQIFDVPDMAQTVRVDDGGNATLNLIGQIHLAGLNISQAEAVVAEKYSTGHFLVNPQVTLLVHEYVTQGVSVLGEVQHPGVYPVLGPRTIFDVLSAAGGITQYAGNTVSVQRASDGSIQTIALSGRKLSPLSSDVNLEPGDKVVVPRAGIVFVIGDVNRPGGFVMEDDGSLSILQALSLAMGPHATASLNKAKLIHKSQNGYVESPVELKKILNGKQLDRQMQADDILYVPNSFAKAMVYRGAPTAVSAATAASIYRGMY